MKRFIRFAGIAVGFILCRVVLTHSAMVEVQMTGSLTFSPDPAMINQGDTIQWRNTSSSVHTSTSGTSCAANLIWDSGNVSPGGTYSRPFTSAGNFPYFCIPHCDDGMTGTVIVQGVGVEEKDDLRLNPELDSGEDLKIELFQNQPNPFHNSTLIQYQIPMSNDNPESSSGQMTNIRLAIYDITGRLVETLVNERQEPGVYQVEWEGKDQANGIYFYTLRSGNYRMTRKLILLH